MAGVTLVELMATVGILAVVVVAGSASFRATLASGRVAAMENEFIAGMAFARSEAVRRGRAVRFSAVDAAAASNEWGPGFRVWLDEDDDGDFTADDDVELRIRATEGAGPSFDSVGNVTEVRFTSAGFISGFVGDTPSASSSSFRLCDGKSGRLITLRATGQISTQTLTCG